LRASAGRAGTDSAIGDVTVADDDVTAISAAGAPLVRIAAINEGGGAGPFASVVCEVGVPTLAVATPRKALDVPESAGDATGAGVEVEDKDAAVGAAGSGAAAFELAGAALPAGWEAVLVSITGAGAGAGATAGAGSIAGGGCTTAGAGVGATSVAGAGLTGAGV